MTSVQFSVVIDTSIAADGKSGTYKISAVHDGETIGQVLFTFRKARSALCLRETRDAAAGMLLSAIDEATQRALAAKRTEEKGQAQP